MPRLRGRGRGLSQQAGGIGTRGPGETQLEVDRRRLLRRATKLEAELRALTKNRRTQRKARARSRLQTLALVGYTNAGKSTLLNRLTQAEVTVEDRLFATVDPTTRRLDLPGGERVLVTDTVGFVRKLPHQLVESFRSTLEEVAEADLLVHVVDVAGLCAPRSGGPLGPGPAGHMEAVRTVLADIGAEHVPELIAFNQADRLGAEGRVEAKRLLDRHPGGVLVSAATGEGIDELVTAIGDRLRAVDRVVELIVPYDRGDVVAAIHRQGEVLSEEHGSEGTTVRARLRPAEVARFAEFQVG